MHLVDGRRHRLRRLPRQTVDEIKIDRRNPRVPQPGYRRSINFVRLAPVNRLWHDQVRILNAQRCPIHSHRPQRGDVLRGRVPKIDLDPQSRIFGKLKPALDLIPSTLECIGWGKCWRASAQVELTHQPLGIDLFETNSISRAKSSG